MEKNNKFLKLNKLYHYIFGEKFYKKLDFEWHKYPGRCQIIQEIINLVENYHKKQFWFIFIELVDEHKNYDVNSAESGASEYEIYFNYMLLNHKDKIITRQLNWSNNHSNYQITKNDDQDYISICSWIKYYYK